MRSGFGALQVDGILKLQIDASGHGGRREMTLREAAHLGRGADPVRCNADGMGEMTRRIYFFDVFPGDGPGNTRAQGGGSSVALTNLRALVIIIVVAFHSVLAYLGSLRAAAFDFDTSPYEWRAFPIVDSHRWFGFDLFCAWQDTYLMALMFFLSALFTWPSLARKGSRKFLGDRLLRLGVPFVFAVIVVIPIALYPVYRVTAVDPGLHAYAAHFLALPFWPNGPMWFLWQLLVFTAVAAGLHRFAPQLVERFARLCASAGSHPGRFFGGLAIVSALAYVPLALVYTPWTWSEHGPLAMQFSRPLLYAVYYFAGLGIGAHGIERGLLARDGMLARRWKAWAARAFAAFLLWMGVTALAMNDGPSAPFALQLAVNVSYALACASGCFLMLAVCLRFGAMQSKAFDRLAKDAFGIYLLHYAFVVWLQYALLGVALFAFAKAMVVFGGALLFAWATVTGLRTLPFGAQLIGEERRARATPPPLRGSLARDIAYEHDPATLRPANIAR
jgi:peptidoglycan/LPS O-acetylase OafA/YrhL